jgi:hypothetical protein
MSAWKGHKLTSGQDEKAELCENSMTVRHAQKLSRCARKRKMKRDRRSLLGCAVQLSQWGSRELAELSGGLLSTRPSGSTSHLSWTQKHESSAVGGMRTSHQPFGKDLQHPVPGLELGKLIGRGSFGKVYKGAAHTRVPRASVVS